jgi:hypothetical protein
VQRWRLEVQSIADELEFHDDAPANDVQAAIEKRLTEMCDQSPAFYWRVPEKRAINPIPRRFR